MLRFLQGIAYCLLAIPLMLLLMLPSAVMDQPWGATYSWQQTALGCLLVLLVVAVAYSLAKKWGYIGFDRDFFRWKTLILVSGTWVLTDLIGRLGHLWLEALGKSDTLNNQLILERIASLPPIFVWFNMTLLPAVLEEVICRGLFMTKLFGRNSWPALILSSLLFAALHGPTDLPSWLIYGSGGLAMGYLYKRTGNLAYPMALHFLNNALVTLDVYV